MGEVAAPAWVGRELGAYRVARILGSGGMGIVLEAEHMLLGRRAAIKTIKPELVTDASVERRFLLEARAVASLDHPSIVRLYDFSFDGDMPYMVMELVTGRTLDQLLDAPIPPRAALEIILPVAAALDYAHEHGVVHRDVKPANILLGDDGRTMVMDFGLALFAGISVSTDPGSVVGTPDYIAPEQLTGSHVDHRADIYSLSAIVYEMVAGHRPFTGANWIEVASQRLHEPAPRAEGMPRAFAQALADGLERNPGARPDSALGLVTALACGLGLSVTFDDKHPALRPLAAVDAVDVETRVD
jgi:eukaryotic-like serine/threonine-protein kinase